MSAIFSAFGIDWRLLLIDCINFGLLLLVLWYFLYTPLLTMIERRRAQVAQGVIDAQNASQALAQIEASRAEKLAEAGKEADDVMAKARTAATAREREMLAAAEASAARVAQEAEAQARDAKERAIEESKKEVAKLIVLGIEKAVVQK